jgi:hypothetical protein
MKSLLVWQFHGLKKGLNILAYCIMRCKIKPLRSLIKILNRRTLYLYFHPYYLKEYNNRWFYFGLHPESWNQIEMSLWQIVDVAPIDVPFIPNETIDWQEYFSDMIGVSIGRRCRAENVVLHFNQLTVDICFKSIHETQKT